ncbi:MAG: hypothetical protein JXX14_07155 [Deltaproteobacteria bacterium]|nr:hypothetical protein [Deltaproteobacteria bacterium]
MTKHTLDSLSAVGDTRIRVGRFSENLATKLSNLDAELLYALAAICQHENLSVSEVRDVLNVSTDFASLAIGFLTEWSHRTKAYRQSPTYSCAAILSSGD